MSVIIAQLELQASLKKLAFELAQQFNDSGLANPDDHRDLIALCREYVVALEELRKEGVNYPKYRSKLPRIENDIQNMKDKIKVFKNELLDMELFYRSADILDFDVRLN